jgi:hypothetical protein
VEKRMLIEMLPSILLTGLCDTFPVGVTVNTLKTFPSVDRNAMMRKEARKRLRVLDRYLFTTININLP